MRDHRKAEFREPTERHKQVADKLLAGESIQSAMVSSGYAPSSSRNGRARIPKAVLKLMPKLAKSNLMMLGEMKAEDRKTLVRGRLVYGAITGSDKGVLAAKQLGADKDLAMWQPDTQTGIIVISPPQSAMDDKAKILDAPEEDR